jgi:alpha-1,6-mannosyltransferase
VTTLNSGPATGPAGYPRRVPVPLLTTAAARLRAREPVSRHALVGLVGSTVLAVGALGVGYMPPRSRLGVLDVIDTLRSTTVGVTISRICVVVGVLLLLRAWWRLGDDVRAGLVTGPARLTRMFWLWCVPLLLVPPLFSQDVYSYTAQGNLLNVGYDPYQFGPSSIPDTNLEAVSPVWLDTPAPYGPLFLLFGKFSAEIFGGHIYLAALAMRVLALLGVWLIAHYLPRLARACGVDPSLAVWGALLNPLVLMHFVSGAHNDALMLGLLIAGITLALEGHPLIGTVAIALGAAIKAPPLLALGFVGLAWAMHRSGRLDSPLRARILPWVAVAATALGTFLVVNAVSGLGFGWIEALGTPGMIHTWLSPVTTIALPLGAFGSLIGLGDHTDGIMEVLRFAAYALVLGAITWWLLRKRAIAPAMGTAVAMLMLAVLGPVLQPWYLLWGLILVVAAGIGLRGVPYLHAVTTMFVVYCLIQPSATSAPLVRLSDWMCSAITLAVGATMLMRNPQTRAEILGLVRRGGPSTSPPDAEGTDGTGVSDGDRAVTVA